MAKNTIVWDLSEVEEIYKLEQHNKQHYEKIMLNSFHLHDHPLGFHPQTQKLEAPCTA